MYDVNTMLMIEYTQYTFKYWQYHHLILPLGLHSETSCKDCRSNLKHCTCSQIIDDSLCCNSSRLHCEVNFCFCWFVGNRLVSPACPAALSSLRPASTIHLSSQTGDASHFHCRTKPGETQTLQIHRLQCTGLSCATGARHLIIKSRVWFQNTINLI